VRASVEAVTAAHQDAQAVGNGDERRQDLRHGDASLVHASRSAAPRPDATNVKVQLVAPQHIHAEVPSAIMVATRGRQARLIAAQGAAAISEFLALDLPTYDDDQVVTDVYPAAQQYGCAFYDGFYLALAPAAQRAPHPGRRALLPPDSPSAPHRPVGRL
jgi:predicted nucleic acid-binding protein